MVTVTRLFDDYSDAQQALRELEQRGIAHEDLSIMASNADERHGAVAGNDDAVETDLGRGAVGGAIVGGGAGLLAGLGMLAIPGVGPIVAAGWLAATAVGAGVGAAGGATVGGIVGALRESGHSEEEAHIYSEGLRRGGTVLSAKVDRDRVAEVEDIFRRHHGVDADTRGRFYREAGWSSFDENAPPYTRDQIATERERYRAQDI